MISYNDNNLVMMFGSNLNELWGILPWFEEGFFFKICDIKNVEMHIMMYHSVTLQKIPRGL
jgi:hypothetical protein